MEHYCVKCKERRTIKDITDVKYANGRYAKKGTCETCGGTVCKIVAAPK